MGAQLLSTLLCTMFDPLCPIVIPCMSPPSPAQSDEFARVQEPLFRQISRCLTSSHFQVRHARLSVASVLLFLLRASSAAVRCVSRVPAAGVLGSASHWCPAAFSCDSGLGQHISPFTLHAAERSLFLWNMELRAPSEPVLS